MRLTRILAAVAAMSLTAACVVDQPDYLKLTVQVLNGGLPISNLQVTAYDWSVRFDDASEISIRLTFDNPFTGVDGTLAAVSYDLNLSSGDEYYSCYDVCIDWDIYGYCSLYAEDCSSTSYSMDIYNITRARAAIAWARSTGTSTTTGYTWNNNVTLAATGHCQPNTWCQNDVFEIGFGADGKSSSAATKPATIPFAAQETLTDAQKAEIAKARTHIIPTGN